MVQDAKRRPFAKTDTTHCAMCCIGARQISCGHFPVHWDQLQAQRSVTSMAELYIVTLLFESY